MKPSERESGNADFLSGPFVTIPHAWLTRIPQLGLSPSSMLILLLILSAQQVERVDFLTPQELATMSGLGVHEVAEEIGHLISKELLAIGERLDDNGAFTNYFDLKPLWTSLRGRNQNEAAREWRKDTVTLFEEEFGRPLSGIECEQIRQWMERDGHADWMIVEALREAVLANKYSFKYIDRILYDWHRNRIRTKTELESYREQFRDKLRSREEVAASRRSSNSSPPRTKNAKDERYSAFYELFPDS